ncbi:MAG TPA: hypothetical protein VL326_32355 [Kofleriaceae bacterium]|jgi:hypothetical protein|nr:hypothetical protein [Kofleriaceae bacterium]
MKASLIITIVLALAVPAYAGEPVVLAIDGQDIYVDLGAKDGVGAGSELELLHEVNARDPRTGATLKDRFALGTMTVAKSGASVSVAHADQALTKRVLVGDQVRLVSEKRAFVDPWEEQVAASKGQPAPLPTAPTPQTPVTPSKAIDHATLARDAWQDTLGKPLEARITRWTSLLAADPQTPYRKAVELEIQNLRYQMQQREAALAQAQATHTDARDPRIAQLAAQLEVPAGQAKADLVLHPIDRAVPGRPIQLAFLMRRPSLVHSAWLYVRAAGAPGFSRTELVRDGDSYLRGTIPGEQVKGDKVDWYVEVAGADGEAMPMVGSQAAPNRIEIDDIVGEAPIEQGRTHIDGHIDYVDFDGKFNDGYDQYTQAELDFTYRFIRPIYAFRVGFGTLTGTGGPASVIDMNNACKDVNDVYQCARMTFSYVYTEAEFRIRPNVALMVRPTGGVLTTDTMPDSNGNRCQGSSNINDCEFFTGFGMRGRLRLGSELGTNLVLGASFTARVGTLIEAAYHWLPNPIVPVQITVQVTDQPVVEDFGVRLIGDVGIRRVAWFYPSARVSYQARNINHAGVSGGFALNFDW